MNLKYKIISILLATIIVFTVKNNVNNTNYIDNDNVSNKATETIENIIEPEIETTERIITQKTTKKNKYKKGYIKANNVNVRAKKRFTAKIKGHLFYGEKINYIRVNKKWVKINNKKIKGYVLAKYVTRKKKKHKLHTNVPNYTLFSYMDYTCITNTSSQQYKLQRRAYTGTYGIRQVDGRYCIALGSYYTTRIGTYIDLILNNGQIIHCILADCKADQHTDAMNQKTSDGSLVEFVVDTPALYSKAKRMGDIAYCNPKWQSRIKYIKIYV